MATTTITSIKVNPPSRLLIATAKASILIGGSSKSYAFWPLSDIEVYTCIKTVEVRFTIAAYSSILSLNRMDDRKNTGESLFSCRTKSVRTPPQNLSAM
jgi:hypothetical protein